MVDEPESIEIKSFDAQQKISSSIKWLILASLLIFLVGFVIAEWAGMDNIEKLGSYIAGLSSLVASMWVVAALTIQGDQLVLQQKELLLQRRELTLQRLASESASTSTRIQLLISLFDQALNEADHLARDMVVLLLPESSILAESDRFHAQGEKDAHIRALLEDTNLHNAMDACALEQRTSFFYIADLFITRFSRIGNLLNANGIDEEIKRLLYTDRPIGQLIPFIEKLSQSVRNTNNQRY